MIYELRHLRCLLLIAPLACGPAVGTDDDGGGTSEGTTSGAPPVTTGPRPGGESGGVTSTNPTTSPGSATDPSTDPTTDPGSTTSPDDSGSGSTSDNPFLIPPDGGLDGFPCSTFDQDCAKGEACRAWANDGGPVWNFVRCSPVAAEPDGVGEPCVVEGHPATGIDSCDVGAMCVNVDEDTLEGSCAEFCGGSPEEPSCPDPTTDCVQGNDGWVALCMVSCDPLLQDCGGGQACVGSWGSYSFFCATPELPYEDPDGIRVAACGVGRVAVPPDLRDDCDGSEPCCVDFCDLGEVDPDCGEGFTCGPFAPEGMMPGPFFVGACVSP